MGRDISSCATLVRVKDSSICEGLQTLTCVYAGNLIYVYIYIYMHILRNILEMHGQLYYPPMNSPQRVPNLLNSQSLPVPSWLTAWGPRQCLHRLRLVLPVRASAGLWGAAYLGILSTQTYRNQPVFLAFQVGELGDLQVLDLHHLQDVPVSCLAQSPWILVMLESFEPVLPVEPRRIMGIRRQRS